MKFMPGCATGTGHFPPLSPWSWRLYDWSSL